MIYSSKLDGFSFSQLSKAVAGYQADLMILFKDKKDDESFLMGIYCAGELQDKALWHGDPSNLLFTLSPKLEVANTFESKGGSHYQYFNSMLIEGSKFDQGIGFGGKLGAFRLFFSADDLSRKSYLLPEDDTYAVKLMGAKRK